MQHTIGTTVVVDRAAPRRTATAPHSPIRRAGIVSDRSAIVAVALGAAVRLAWLAYARPEPVSDFRHYLDTAYALLDTGTFGVGQPSAWRLPGYPAVLAAGALVSRDPIAPAVLTVGISVVQITLTWWLAWRIFGSRPAAAVAGGVAALAPAFVTFAPVLASEHLLAVCLLAALALVIGPRDADTPPQRARDDPPATASGAAPAWRWALPAGLLLGAGALTRGEALAYLPVVGIVAAGRRLRTNSRITSAARAASVVVLGVALVAVPWAVRNNRLVGPGVGLTTTSGFNFFLAHSPGGYGWRTPLPLPLLVDDEVTRNALGWRYGLRYVRRHPDEWWPTVRRGTHELLTPSTYAARYATVARDPASGRISSRDDLALRHTAIALAGRSSRWLLCGGLLGVALVPVWRRSGWVAVVGVAVANWALYAVLFWAQARYRYIVDALACVAVSAPAAAVGAWRARARTMAGAGACARDGRAQTCLHHHGDVAFVGDQDVGEARLGQHLAQPRRARLTTEHRVTVLRQRVGHAHEGRRARTGSWTQQWTTLRNVAERLAQTDHDAVAAILLRAVDADPDAPEVTGDEAARLASLRSTLVDRLGPAAFARARERAARSSRAGVVERGLTTVTSTARAPD